MQLKNRLSIYSVLIFSVVIFVASAAIYISFYRWMKHNEIQILESKTLLAAVFYLEQDESSNSEHESIKDKLRKSISRKDIAIYNTQNIVARGEMLPDKNITVEFLNTIRKNRQANFTTDRFFYNGLFYADNEGNFVVVARELKDDFDNQMYTLLQILIVVFVIGVILIYLFSQLLGRFAYEPIIQIIEQIKERDNKNFYEPIVLEKSYTEIEDLVRTYNHFIDRLAQTFHVQKNFIDYVSHELRTPITALMGTLEVTHQKKRTVDEYQQAIVQSKQYVYDLEETLDKMMLLSGVKTSFEFKTVRIDEIIWQVIENAVLYHQAQIDVKIEVEDSVHLNVYGNTNLLALAFSNLVENAVKYSDNQPVEVLLKSVGSSLQIEIIDRGIGIPESDLNQITQNFYRGKNTKGYQGKGIGLSMAQIVFSLHRMELSVYSDGKGTVVKVSV